MAGDYNKDYGFDFFGGLAPKDFSFAYNNDFSGGFPPPPPPPPDIPPIIKYFPSEYVAVPANRAIHILAEYRTIKIEPEGW
jgi:hypothetical protein